MDSPSGTPNSVRTPAGSFSRGARPWKSETRLRVLCDIDYRWVSWLPTWTFRLTDAESWPAEVLAPPVSGMHKPDNRSLPLSLVHPTITWNSLMMDAGLWL